MQEKALEDPVQCTLLFYIPSVDTRGKILVASTWSIGYGAK